MECGGYSIGIAQIDDEIDDKLNFRICPNATVSLLVSRSDMHDMRRCSIVGKNKQHDAILESFGTTKKNHNFAHSLTVNNLSSSSLFPLQFPKILSLSLLFALFNLRKFPKSNFDLAAKSPRSKLFCVKLCLSRKTLIFESILNRFMTQPQNLQNPQKTAIPQLLIPNE